MEAPAHARRPVSKTKLHAVSTAAELVEHHPGRAGVHAVVSVEAAKRIESAIHDVDTIVLNLDRIAILDLIFGHVSILPGRD
jgi:hypothetical protein